MKSNSLVLNLVLILVLGLVSFSVYFNSLHGEFLIDDQTGILNNKNIHNLGKYFSQHFSLRPGILNETTKALLWHISGGKTFVFHLFNVFVHAGCVILIFVLLSLLFKNRMLSFLSSLIFAVHPIHTEAISWISGGPYAYAGLFFLASFIFYIKSNKSIANLILCIIFFGLCLFTGNIVAVLPLAMIAYELFFREQDEAGNKFLSRMRIAVLLAIFSISLLIVAMFFVTRNQFMHTIYYFRGNTYLIVAAKAFVYYLKIIYLPLARGLYHPFAYNTTDTNKVTPALFISIAAISILIFAFIKCLKNHKPISFGIAWFFITYLPYSNIIPVCNIISERYVYLPSLGFCIILAYLALKAWEIINKNTQYRKFLRIISVTVIALFLISYASLTVKHNRDYRDIITYWHTNINNFPDGYMAYNNLAGTYYVMGEIEQAKAYSWVTLMINPEQPHVWSNLGMVYRNSGDIKMAKFCYGEALKLDSGFNPAIKALEEIKQQEEKEAGAPAKKEKKRHLRKGSN